MMNRVQFKLLTVEVVVEKKVFHSKNSLSFGIIRSEQKRVDELYTVIETPYENLK